MKKLATAFVLTLLLTACEKEDLPASDPPEEVRVMVYATYPGDTTQITSTEVIRVQVR
jgi:hypothetical protein